MTLASWGEDLSYLSACLQGKFNLNGSLGVYFQLKWVLNSIFFRQQKFPPYLLRGCPPKGTMTPLNSIFLRESSFYKLGELFSFMSQFACFLMLRIRAEIKHKRRQNVLKLDFVKCFQFHVPVRLPCSGILPRHLCHPRCHSLHPLLELLRDHVREVPPLRLHFRQNIADLNLFCWNIRLKVTNSF